MGRNQVLPGQRRQGRIGAHSLTIHHPVCGFACWRERKRTLAWGPSSTTTTEYILYFTLLEYGLFAYLSSHGESHRSHRPHVSGTSRLAHSKSRSGASPLYGTRLSLSSALPALLVPCWVPGFSAALLCWCLCFIFCILDFLFCSFHAARDKSTETRYL